MSKSFDKQKNKNKTKVKIWQKQTKPSGIYQEIQRD